MNSGFFWWTLEDQKAERNVDSGGQIRGEEGLCQELSRGHSAKRTTENIQTYDDETTPHQMMNESLRRTGEN